MAQAPGCELWYWRWDRFERAYDADRAPARAPRAAARAGGRALVARSSPRRTSSRAWRAPPAGGRSSCRWPPTRSPRPQGGDVVAISLGHLGWRTDWSLLRAVSERLGDRLVLLLVGAWHEEECKDDPDFAFCRAAANLVWLGRVEDEAAARLVLCADVGHRAVQGRALQRRRAALPDPQVRPPGTAHGRARPRRRAHVVAARSRWPTTPTRSRRRCWPPPAPARAPTTRCASGRWRRRRARRTSRCGSAWRRSAIDTRVSR